jgi:hypothetical protein
MDKPRIIITCSGGVVTDVICDREINCDILDYDEFEEANPEQCQHLKQLEAEIANLHRQS